MNILGILDYNTFNDDYITIAEFVENSITYLWLRIKDSDSSIVYKRAEKLRNRISKCKLIMSDDIAIATALQFDGVHLNERSIPVDIAKNITGYNMIIGYSAHSIKEINNINADYLTLSPIMKAKTPYESIINIDILDSDKDIFALGGVKITDYNLLINKGFQGIAGISLLSEIIDYKKRKGTI